jgi:NADH-ubiquinone oxidoreductase chain 5
MAAPTPVSSLVHSSTLVTAGVYLLIRLSDRLSLFGGGAVSLLIGGLTMLLAGIRALFEPDIKKIVALSTLSQLGLIIASLGLGS